MANNRVNIRAAIKTTLINASTSAGSNVFTNRDVGLSQSELPSINIYTEQEPVVPESITVRRYIRKLELKLDLRLEATTSVDDDLDSFVGEVEDAISSNPSASGTLLSTILTNTEIKIDSAGENPIGVATLTYQCQYIS